MNTSLFLDYALRLNKGNATDVAVVEVSLKAAVILKMVDGERDFVRAGFNGDTTGGSRLSENCKSCENQVNIFAATHVMKDLLVVYGRNKQGDG